MEGEGSVVCSAAGMEEEACEAEREGWEAQVEERVDSEDVVAGAE